MNRQHWRLLVLCILLTGLAAAFRFYRLDALSFYADEEITALVANSLNAGQGARLPSGLEYRRALPFTWLSAASARWFGRSSEAAYRLPSALLGALSVPMLFLLGRSLINERVALLSALLLAFSEWHLAFSRQARMYAPLLFFYLAAVFAVLLWSRTAKTRYAVIALLLFATAATLHLTAATAALFALVPVVVAGWSRIRNALLAAFAMAAIAGTLAWERFFVAPPYRGWGLPRDPGARTPERVLDLVADLPTMLLAGAGAALAVWAATLARRPDQPRAPAWHGVATYASAAAAGALAATGQLYGAALALAVFLLLQPISMLAWSRRVAWPVALLSALIAVGVSMTLVRAGDLRLTESLRALVTFPRPYALMLAEQMPGICLLFALGVGLLACRPRSDQELGPRIIGLGVLGSLAALGLSSRAPHTRYVFALYPFLLLVAGWSLLALAILPRRWLSKWNHGLAWATAAAVALSGMLTGHGLGVAVQQARLEHGQPIAERPNQFSFRPDHKSAGQYVRRVRGPADIVIAEDASMQRWYAGPIHYWFRRYGDARAYLYASTDGLLRETYGGSIIAAFPQTVDSIAALTRGRVWLITSGETAPLHSWYLSAAQSRWLDSIAHVRAPAFVAQDTVTRVYCLNCGIQTGQRR